MYACMIIMFAGLDNIFMTAYSACTASIINSNKLIICRNDLPIPLVVAMDPAQTKIDGCEAFNQPAWNWVENISQAFWHIICSLRDTRVLSFSQLERHQWAGVSNHPSSKAATVAIFMALWTRMECNGWSAARCQPNYGANACDKCIHHGWAQFLIFSS